MLDYNTSPYVTWIKHLKDYKIGIKVLEADEGNLSILVHPAHKPLTIDLSMDIYSQVDGQDKTIQLYFYSCAWVVATLSVGGAEEKVTALSLLSRILDISPSQERKGSWNMLWDDHAVCERLCVLIDLVRNYNLREYIDFSKLNSHIEKVAKYIISELVQDERWHNNNHRLFHLFSAYAYSTYIKDEAGKKSFLDLINGFVKSLIDFETGFAREQCISYCFFDLDVVKKVVDSLLGLSDSIEFNVSESEQKLYRHINALSFPDGSLPACGDTPVGLKLSSYQKRFAVPNNELWECWERLEKLGYYRGESPNRDIQFLMLSHNGESAHGHYSPLHTDVWFSDIGSLLTDSGGPYKYGDKSRYTWFRASRGHNSLTGKSTNFLNLKRIDISVGKDRSYIQGIANYSCSVHFRKVFSDEGYIEFSEVISSIDEKLIHYNFSQNVIVERVDDLNYLITGGGATLELKIILQLGSLDARIEETLRCTGHSRAVSATSLILSLGEGLTSYTIRILKKV